MLIEEQASATQKCACVHTHTCMHAHTHTEMRMRAHMHIHTCTHTHTHKHTHTHTHTQCAHTHRHIHTQANYNNCVTFCKPSCDLPSVAITENPSITRQKEKERKKILKNNEHLSCTHNALSTHMIHINLNLTVYMHEEHVLQKQFVTDIYNLFDLELKKSKFPQLNHIQNTQD